MLRMGVRHRIAAVALAAFLLAPAAVAAAQVTATQQTATYFAELEPEYGAGAYDGVLKLVYEPSGVISGTYRPFDGSPRFISGGTDANGIWLDIGLDDHTLIYAKNAGGTLEGTAWFPRMRYSFEAKPIAP
jgi:hypothetical protein